MKKLKICLILTLIMLSSIFVYLINKKEYLSTDDILGVYVNNELSDKIPSSDEALFQKADCDNNVNIEWDNDNWGLLISNMNTKIKCNLYFYSGQTVFNFEYTGSEQTFTVPISGTYKLETWGAQGGGYRNNDTGAEGGYSSGLISLNKTDTLYLYIGGMGKFGIEGESGTLQIGAEGGYNGGGSGGSGNNVSGGGGGGATHIAKTNGLLKDLKNNIDDILIVSGGGGGGASWGFSGAGGGFKGSDTHEVYDQQNRLFPYKAIGGSSDNESINFGYGADAPDRKTFYSWGAEGKGGGGSGFYGGNVLEAEGQWTNCAGAGGSGYIGNTLLTSKVMYCYNCEESSEESTKTISTTCSEETPTVNCSKKGNGYARITLISIDE